MEQWEKLVEILLDEEAADAERDDAAMDLSEYSHKNVAKALLIISNRDSTDDMIKASCGESLAMILVNNDRFDNEIYNQLRGIAKIEFESYISLKKNDWKGYLNT